MLVALVDADLTVLPSRQEGKGLVLDPCCLSIVEKMLLQRILTTKRGNVFVVCFLLVAIHDDRVGSVSWLTVFWYLLRTRCKFDTTVCSHYRTVSWKSVFCSKFYAKVFQNKTSLTSVTDFSHRPHSLTSETTTKSAFFKLLELPWCSPSFTVHSHYNTEPHRLLKTATKSAFLSF